MKKNFRFRSAVAAEIQKRKHTIKLLSFAMLASIAGFSPNFAYAEEVNISQKPINVPTLDYLRNNNITIPGVFRTGSAEDSVTVNHYYVSDNNGNIHTLYSVYHVYGEDFSPEKYKELLNSGKLINYKRSNDLHTSLKDLQVETYEDAIAKLTSQSSSGSFITNENPKIAYDEYLKSLPASAISTPISDYQSAYTVTKVDDKSQSDFAYKIYNSDGNLSIDYYKINLKETIPEVQNSDGNIIGSFINSSETIFNSGGTIYNIVGDFINNSITPIRNCTGMYWSPAYIYNITGSFINNSNGAIYSERGTYIGNIVGDFINNSKIADDISYNGLYADFEGTVYIYGRGGAIYSAAKINSISGNFINNKSSIEGGALYIAEDVVKDIKGNFIDNSVEAYGDGVFEVSGGAIAFGSSVDTYGSTVAILPETIKGNFIENAAISDKTSAGGAISEFANTNYINVEDSNFINNKALSTDTDAKGGAISLYYKPETDVISFKKVDEATLKNTNFIGNHAEGKTAAKGGAIYSGQNLNIIADNGVSKFSDNYVIINGNRENQAIYMDSNNRYNSSYKIMSDPYDFPPTTFTNNSNNFAPTLNITAKNNGQLIINDKISGSYTYDNIRYRNPENSVYEFLDKNNSVIQKFTNDYRHAIISNILNKDNQIINTHRYNNYSQDYDKELNSYVTSYDVLDEYLNKIDNRKVAISREDINAKIIKVYDADKNKILDTQYSITDEYDSNLRDRIYTVKHYDDMYNEVVSTERYTESTRWITNGAGLQKYCTRNYLDENNNIIKTVSYTPYSNGWYDIYEGNTLKVKSSGSYDVSGKTIHTCNILDKDNNILKTFKYYYEYNRDEAKIVGNDDISIKNNSFYVTHLNILDEDGNITETIRYNSTKDWDNEKNDYVQTYHIYDEKYNEIDTFTSKSENILFTGYIPIKTYEDTYKLVIDGDETGQVHLNDTVDTRDLDNNVKPMDVSLANTNLFLGRENVLNGNNLTLNSGFMSMINNQVGVSALKSLNITGDTNFAADVDLLNQEMDRFTADAYGSHSGNLNVVGMNLLTDEPADRKYTAIYFAQPGLKEFVTNSIGDLPNNKFQNFEILTPIYKYKVTYDKNTDYGKGDGGYFVFTKGDKVVNTDLPQGSGSSSGPNISSTGNKSDAFNPAVLTAPVSTVAASQATMNEVFRYVFEHADAFSQLPAIDRYNQMNANNFALSSDFNNNFGRIQEDLGSLSYEYKNNKAPWVRPYTTFETMNLKNGPDVDAINYGTIIGYDGDFKKMRNGWYRMGTSYIGYNGSQLNYANNDTTLNGGLLGITETYYKGNFWSAITASAGASVGETNTMYGKEDYTSLLAGIATKTGYNFEYKEGKYIFQPIIFLSYTFVNTFDYKNAAGVKINSDPAHSIILHPNLRFIMNCKNGWQPYLQAGVVWNLLNKSHITANGIVLPNMSMDPYAEYGIGVQRSWNEKFTAFGQAMVRNGSRNGIAFTAGFRWAIGRDNNDKPEHVYTPNKFKKANI